MYVSLVWLLLVCVIKLFSEQLSLGERRRFGIVALYHVRGIPDPIIATQPSFEDSCDL